MTIGTPAFYPSSPIQIRDGIATRLLGAGLLRKIFKARKIPTKDEHLPFAAVWYPRDRMEPNGDADVGMPSFLHTITFMVEVLAKCPPDVEPTVEEDFVTLVETLRAALLTDPTWVDLLEGIERCEIDYRVATESNLNMAQAIMEIEVTIRSEWPPVVPNDFRSVTVTPIDPEAASDTGPFNDFTTEFGLPDEDDIA